MLCRLKDRRGETLVEILLSLLIAVFAMIMFAGMIAATVRITEEGKTLNNKINDRNALLEQRVRGENVEEKEGTVTITGLITDKTVNFYKANYGGGEDVISYGG